MKQFACLALAVMLGGLLPTTTFGSVILADTFTPADPGRPVGAALPGKPVETGSGNWAGDSSWLFTADGRVRNSTGSSDASLSFAAVTEPLRLQVQFDFAGHTGTNYGMIGMASGGVTQPYNWALWLFVRGNGAWEIREVTTSLASGSGLATGSGLHELVLEYDPVAGNASAWYDGALLASDKALTSPPALVRAGFGTTIVGLEADNFQLSTVPEPATLVLLAAASLAGLRRRR